MKRRDPHQWARSHAHDPFVKQAKLEGYRARSSYKLIEIIEKTKLLPKNAVVLDLGCAPGAWLQVLKKMQAAKIVGIDLLKITPVADTIFLKADIFSDEAANFLEGYSFNVILSDMAPNCSGQKELNHIWITNLAHRVMELSQKHLKIGGNLCIKLFDGSQTKDFVQQFSKLFQKTSRIKPKASNLDSNEFYLIGIHYKGTEATDDAPQIA